MDKLGLVLISAGVILGLLSVVFDVVGGDGDSPLTLLAALVAIVGLLIYRRGRGIDSRRD